MPDSKYSIWTAIWRVDRISTKQELKGEMPSRMAEAMPMRKIEMCVFLVILPKTCLSSANPKICKWNTHSTYSQRSLRDIGKSSTSNPAAHSSVSVFSAFSMLWEQPEEAEALALLEIACQESGREKGHPVKEQQMQTHRRFPCSICF